MTTADFGFVAPLTLDEGGKRSGSVGTLSFMAPEMFDDRDYAAGIDIWASGIVAIGKHFELFPWGALENASRQYLPTPFYGYYFLLLISLQR